MPEPPTAPKAFVDRSLEDRVARLAFGDSTAFRHSIPIDRQLNSALDYLHRGLTHRQLLALVGTPAPNGSDK